MPFVRFAAPHIAVVFGLEGSSLWYMSFDVYFETHRLVHKQIQLFRVALGLPLCYLEGLSMNTGHGLRVLTIAQKCFRHKACIPCAFSAWFVSQWCLCHCAVGFSHASHPCASDCPTPCRRALPCATYVGQEAGSDTGQGLLGSLPEFLDFNSKLFGKTILGIN